MRILGIDPGKRNSWFVLITPFNLGIKLLRTAQIDMAPDFPLNERMEHLQKQVQLLLKINPNLIGIERFITRPGKGMGNVSEIINIFIALLWSGCKRKKIPLKLVTASQHKTWFKKTKKKTAQQLFTGVNDHQADALSIAIYSLKHL